MQNDIHIVQKDAESSDIEYVRKRFIEFNDKQSGLFPSKALNYISYNSEEKIVGGLLADIEWGWLHIDVLWVDESYRSQGIGTDLMEQAESEAKGMGVDNAFIETTDFQALEFYEKRGYTVFAQLEDQPPGHTCYYMKKTRL